MSKAKQFISYVLLMYRRGESIQSENTLVFPREWDRAWDGGDKDWRDKETVAGTDCEWEWRLFFPSVMGYSRIRLKQLLHNSINLFR